jgi:hypothetical protein
VPGVHHLVQPTPGGQRFGFIGQRPGAADHNVDFKNEIFTLLEKEYDENGVIQKKGLK